MGEIPSGLSGPQERGDDIAPLIQVATVAVVVLSPYATVGLNYRASLVAQATLILGSLVLAIVGALSVGVRLSVRRRLTDAISVGVILYGAALLEGTAVALARGNEFRLVAGQMLSMGLLPLGFLCGLLLTHRDQHRWLAWAVVLSVTAAAGAHLTYFALTLSRGQFVPRFNLSDSVAVTGVSLLAEVLATWLAMCARRPWERRAALGAVAVIGIYILGSGIRGLWLVSAAAFVAMAVLARYVGFTIVRARLLLLLSGALLCGLGVGYLYLSIPRDNILAPALERARRVVGPRTAPPREGAPGAQAEIRLECDHGCSELLVGKTVTAAPARAYRWDLATRLEGCPSGWFAIHWRGSDGAFLAENRLQIARPDVWSRESRLVISPERAAIAGVVVGAPGCVHATWSFRSLSLENVGPRWVALLDWHLLYVRSRGAQLLSVITDAKAAQDPSVDTRLSESRRLLRLYLSSSSWVDRALGKGLGARFPFLAMGRADAGERVHVDAPNYIHNFYAFLLYKLGAVGVLLVIAALLLWTFAPLLTDTRSGSRQRRSFLLMASVVWLAYAVWSLASPEILDFRVSPVLGLLLAVTGAVLTSREDPPSAGTEQ